MPLNMATTLPITGILKVNKQRGSDVEILANYIPLLDPSYTCLCGPVASPALKNRGGQENVGERGIILWELSYNRGIRNSFLSCYPRFEQ